MLLPSSAARKPEHHAIVRDMTFSSVFKLASAIQPALDETV